MSLGNREGCAVIVKVGIPARNFCIHKDTLYLKDTNEFNAAVNG